MSKDCEEINEIKWETERNYQFPGQMIQGPETLTLSSLIGDVLSVLITFHFTSRMLLFPDYFQLH